MKEDFLVEGGEQAKDEEITIETEEYNGVWSV